MNIDINTILLVGGAAAVGYWLFAMGGKDQLMGMLGGDKVSMPRDDLWAMDNAIAPRESDFNDAPPPIKQAGVSASGSNMQHATGHIGYDRGYLGQVSFY